MSKSLEKKAAAKVAKEEEKLQETSVESEAVVKEEDGEVVKATKPSKFSVKIYLEGHKQPYVKEFASQGELERAKTDFKKNKSVIRFE